ncbi:glycerol-3-phosphate dehydrogenase/oxidase [Cumulibacter manganitolerans]|uniref:glycerol-3-phosphate dehydrogenase/oxidase n=1 Tax=Cumulibacter manganitolerans TaxID=1884992 RepID=UPI001294FFA2|nr:glycerol-3-phosphate dehydrogenase/oxidase [Cumulibacter manganitolerans]
MSRHIQLPGRRARTGRFTSIRRTPLQLPREQAIADVDSGGEYDVLVIGGGVTGSYVALDCATRGLRVALVEKDDFASGTSSKSSKMVHGGLRYIEQGNLGLVRHALLERQRLRTNAPHLVQRLPFLFPVLAHDGVFDPRLAKAFEGLLWTYDLAGGWRIGRLHQRLTADEVLSRAPLLAGADVRSGFLYYDCRADDARLTLTIARTAAHYGATLLNGARVTGLIEVDGRVRGARVDTGAGQVDVRARVVVNATGVWSDTVDALADPAHEPRVRPGKGVHLVLPWTRLRIDGTVTVPIPGRSRRATCTRWGDCVIVGLTDTDYDGPLDDVQCTGDEMRFLLDGVNAAFGTDLSDADVVGSYAGLRPLVGSKEGATLTMSRDHSITVDVRAMVTVTGGKLTTARHMGELVTDQVDRLLERNGRCRTKTLPLLGGAGYDAEATTATGGLAAHLSGRYGTEAAFVSALIAEDPALGKPIVDGAPHVMAEVVYAARCELARSVDDVLSRRTRLRLFARDRSVDAAPAVAEILGRELDLDAAERDRQVAEYAASIAHEKQCLTTTSSAS